MHFSSCFIVIYVQSIANDVENHKPVIENFVEVTEALIQKAPPEDRKHLEREVNSVKGAWDDIDNQLTARQKKEEEVREEVGKYEKAKADLANVVAQLEKKFDDQKAYADEPKNINQELQDIKVRFEHVLITIMPCEPETINNFQLEG